MKEILRAIVPWAFFVGSVSCIVFLPRWMVYGFTPMDWLRGWRIRNIGDGFPYVLRRFGWQPIAVYWWGSEPETKQRLAEAMCKLRKNLMASKRDLTNNEQRAALRAKGNGRNVWPSREAAIAVGDPGGWYPQGPTP